MYAILFLSQLYCWNFNYIDIMFVKLTATFYTWKGEVEGICNPFLRDRDKLWISILECTQQTQYLVFCLTGYLSDEVTEEGYAIAFLCSFNLSFCLRKVALKISMPFSLRWRSPEQSDIECRYAWRRCDEPSSLTKSQHPDYNCRKLELNWDWLVKTYTPTDQAIEPLSLRQTQLRI